jgi:hypothetical protein
VKSIGDVAGFYLSKRLRRWYVYGPIDLVACLALLVIVICVRGSFVTANAYFEPNPVTEDVESQLAYLERILRNGHDTGRLDIWDGYSQFCGVSAEWDAVFDTFYSMALVELVRVRPDRLENIKRQLDWCARDVLRVPNSMTDAEIEPYFQNKQTIKSPIYGGYVGIVLGLRRSLVKDTRYDAVMRGNALALARYIDSCLEESPQFWTSDHATQLCAIHLFDRTVGDDHSKLFARWLSIMKERFIDKDTGLLISEVSVNPDSVRTEPVGSSIGWTIIFLADVFPDFTREQYAPFVKYREDRILNFAATREYSSKSWIQFGNTDSGPLLFGYGPSACGTMLCSHKLYGDETHFARALRPFEVFGQPTYKQGEKYYHLSNAMGDAILLYAKLLKSRR